MEMVERRCVIVVCCVVMRCGCGKSLMIEIIPSEKRLGRRGKGKSRVGYGMLIVGVSALFFPLSLCVCLCSLALSLCLSLFDKMIEIYISRIYLAIVFRY